MNIFSIHKGKFPAHTYALAALGGNLKAIFPPIQKFLLLWAGFLSQTAPLKQDNCSGRSGFPAHLQVFAPLGGKLKADGKFEQKELPSRRQFSRPFICFGTIGRETYTKIQEKSMKQEELTPNLVLNDLQSRLKELTAHYKKLKSPQNQQISGKLRVTHRGKYVEYYYINNNTSRYGKYLSKKHHDIARQLAQKEYNSKTIAFLEEEITALKTYLVATLKLENYYKNLCPSRQKLITPLTLTNEQYAAQWKTSSYQGLPFAPDSPIYTTNQGERVRSKSEVLIANALAQQKIPYRYEYPLKLQRHHSGGSTTLYPDFLCLNLRTRQEFIWEHFGLMDSQEYVANAVSKLNLYTQNKIHLGRNLIITMESSAEPLTPSVIEQMINVFLK